jgi:type IV secretion system protein VirB10
MDVRGRVATAGLLAVISIAQGKAQTATTPSPQPAAAASPQTAATTPAAQPAAVPTPRTFTLPAGTKILLSLKSAINTKTAQQGDGVYMISSFPVIGSSRVMIPPGVYVQGVVDRVVRPGRVKGRAQLDLHFTTMIFPNGQVVDVPGVLNSLPGSDGPKVKGNEGTVEQAGNKGRDVANVLKGAAI